MYRLSERECALLAAVEFDADKPVGEIAKHTGLRRHSVTYLLAKLREKGILGPRRAAIDIYRLGYSDFHFVFSAFAHTESARAKFIEWLTRSPVVVWLAEVGGAYQYAMSLRVKHVHEVTRFASEAEQTFPGFFGSQELSIVTSLSSYGRRYLYRKQKSSPFVSRAEEPAVALLDALDIQILRGLSELMYSSEREFAARMGEPFSTVRRRITQLEEKRIIIGYYHHIDVLKLGYQIYKLLLFCKVRDPRLSRKLARFAEANVHIVHYLETLGRWQGEFIVEVHEAADASRIAKAVHDTFDGEIDAVHIVPVFQHLQTRPFPLS